MRELENGKLYRFPREVREAQKELIRTLYATAYGGDQPPEGVTPPPTPSDAPEGNVERLSPSQIAVLAAIKEVTGK